MSAIPGVASIMPADGVMGQSTTTQVLTGVVMVVLLYVGMGVLEYLYKSLSGMWKDRVVLFPDTYASGSITQQAIQDPSNPLSRTIYFSDNQRSGIEFSYSMFLNISSDTFSKGDRKLYHILHKGYPKSYPLMGPGIFSWGDKNTLRVFMNSYNTWDNWSDIDNIPIDKWFHLVVACKGSVLYAYINGNLKQKVKLSGGTPPYQNYGDVYAFSSQRFSVNRTTTPSLGADPEFQADPNLAEMTFDGAAKGLISRVYYFSYALTYSEIQSLMNEGPSPKMQSSGTGSVSPYLADTWWTDNGTNGLD